MAHQPKSPVELPVNPTDSRQVWQALAQAAQALLIAARAMQGDLSAPVSLPSLSPTYTSDCTVAEAVNDLMIAKARAERSDRYLRALKNSLGKFCKGRARQRLCDVTTTEIEEWLHSNHWAGRTQKGYLGDVATLFSFGMRRGYCTNNPAKGVEVSAFNPAAPGIHTPDQVRHILELARTTDLGMMRALAIRYFAGLRASEAEGLTEANIKMDQNLIEVPAAKSKTRRRRLVTISPNLREWLAVGGELPLVNVGKRTRRFLAIVRRDGLPWPGNAPRHSFCSYHLASGQNAARTALEAGHSEQMLFAHYRALVTHQEAASYWGIRPGGKPPLVPGSEDKPAQAIG